MKERFSGWGCGKWRVSFGEALLPRWEGFMWLFHHSGLFCSVLLMFYFVCLLGLSHRNKSFRQLCFIESWSSFSILCLTYYYAFK